jgi:hypothetical protein
VSPRRSAKMSMSMEQATCVYTVASQDATDHANQDSRTNRRARRTAGEFSGEKAVRAPCGVGIALLSGAAARRASPGLRLCNHRESWAWCAGMERRCRPIRWLMVGPRTR